MRGVYFYVPEAVAGVPGEPDLFAHQAIQQIEHILRGLVQIKHLGGHGLLAGILVSFGLWTVNLRVMGPDGDPSTPGEVDRELFDRQLTAMIAARDEGLIGGIGLSSISLEHLEIALDRTDIACVQNAYNLLDRSSQPVLDACAARGIAFVPFFPLGSGFAQDNPVLGNPVVQRAARELGFTAAQIALAWTLGVAPNVLLIPGTSSVGHLEENLAVADIDLGEALRAELDAI